MGTCHTKVIKISFDFSDDQITEMTVEQDFWGDCPHTLQRVYKKSFSARLSVIDLIQSEMPSQKYLLW
jgi:hypothetical protein